METREIILCALMTISAVMLTYRWLSLVHNNVDFVVVFFAFLLTFSLGTLLLSMMFRMRRTVEELESTKRMISANADELEKRFEEKLFVYVRELEERLDEIQRRMYR